MNYEIVTLEEKTVAGLTIRTSNDSPSMTQDIGGVWEKFFSQGVYQSIPNKCNGNTIGLYTNYESGVQGAYDMMVCCEVSGKENLPSRLEVKTIPAGSYAKFVVTGNMHEAAAEFWAEFWKMNLDRKFDCDFEEYQSGCDEENTEIHIYISLNL